MRDEDDRHYCAACLVLLEESNHEEPGCQRCGATLFNRHDYLTRSEYLNRLQRDRNALSDAHRDGLFL